MTTCDWQPIASVPYDNRSVLVWLEEPLLGSRVHAARFQKNMSIVGGVFHFDAPKATHWAPQPEGPAT